MSGPVESEEAQAWISPDGGVIESASWDFADCYALMIALVLAPLSLLVYTLTLVLSLPFLALCAWYAKASGPMESVERNLSFGILCLVAFVVHSPVLMLGVVYIAVVFVTAHAACAPVGLLVLGPKRIWLNFGKLRPFADPRSLCPSLESWSDALAAVISLGYRQHLCEFALRYPKSLAWDPVTKYVMSTNPWIGKLATRHCNQWTEPLRFVRSEDEAMILLRHNISRALHREASLVPVDEAVFAAAFPHPPRPRVRSPERPLFRCQPDAPRLATALGVEYAVGVHLARVGHAPLRKVSEKVPLPVPLSQQASRLAYAISLSYFNPLHPLTGYIEVNLRPSLQLEHPVWCVLGAGYFPHKTLADLTEPFFLYAPDVSHFNQHKHRLPLDVRFDQREKHAPTEAPCYQQPRDKPRGKLPRNQVRKTDTDRLHHEDDLTILEEPDEPSSTMTRQHSMDHDDNSFSDDGAAEPMKEGDEESEVKVIVPSPSIEFEVVLNERDLGFSIALVTSKSSGSTAVVVDAVSPPRKELLQVDDVLLRVDDDEPNAQLLAHEQHNLAHFAALVNRIRQGPRPITLTFSRQPERTLDPPTHSHSTAV